MSIQGKMFLLILVLSAVLLSVILGYMFPSMQNALLTEKETKTKEEVQIAWTVADDLYEQALTGAISIEQAKSLAMKEIGALRYGDDNAGYFWISDTNAHMVMDPIKPEMNGKDESGYKDPNGKAIFVEMANIVNKSGEGFVDYMWQYGTDANRIEPKISYVKGFQPWGWVIGTGIYLVDVNQVIGELEEPVSSSRCDFDRSIFVIPNPSWAKRFLKI